MDTRGHRKIQVGTVVSDKMDKTVVVSIERTVSHSNYKKVIRRRTKFKAHDENNDCHIGDRVSIVEARPLSRHKRWRLHKIIERAK